MNNYEVYFHVNDNAETYAHNDSMLVGADSPEEIMQEFRRRIDEEFDYRFSDVDLDSLEVRDNVTKEKVDLTELDIPGFLASQDSEKNDRKNDCMEHD